MEIYLSEM